MKVRVNNLVETKSTIMVHLPETVSVRIRLNSINKKNYYTVNFGGVGDNEINIFDLPESVVFAIRDAYNVKIEDCR